MVSETFSILSNSYSRGKKLNLPVIIEVIKIFIRTFNLEVYATKYIYVYTYVSMQPDENDITRKKRKRLMRKSLD